MYSIATFWDWDLEIPLLVLVPQLLTCFHIKPQFVLVALNNDSETLAKTYVKSMFK